jgi:KaiC/GvpD/RAD55 family RecA-like ATPase
MNATRRDPAVSAANDNAPAAVLVGLDAKIAALGTTGPRLTTGFPTFDAACRGGLPMQRVIVVGGAPGAAKTTTAAQWALRWATQGVPVAFLAADEEAGGILVRWGQACGLTLDDLEEGSDATKAKLAAELDGLPLDLVDSEDADDAITIERVSTELAAKRGTGHASVLIVDSIQMAKAIGTESIDSPRERIDAVVKALKRAAKRDGHLVIVTSELARGAYRDNNEINPLAAFKESGSIEYGVGTALVLRTVDGEPSLIDVAIPKNRIGRSADAKRPFRMRLDFAHATLTEVDLPAQSRTDAAGRAEALEEAVYRVTDANALYSKDAVYAALKSEGSAPRKATVTSLLSAMMDDKRLGWAGRGARIARPLVLRHS